MHLDNFGGGSPMNTENILKQLPIIHVDGVEHVYMSMYECFIQVDDFIEMFGDSDLTYKSLVENGSTTHGWKHQFSDWKEKGILN